MGRNPPQPRTLLFYDGSVDLTQEAPKDSPLGRGVSRSLVKEDWKSVQGDKGFNDIPWDGWVGRKTWQGLLAIELVLLIQPPLSSFLVLY